jgi:hypothetical protein
MNRTVFRTWSEFQDIELDSGGVKLVPVEGVRAFRLVLNPDKAKEVARSISKLMAAELPRVGDGAPRDSTGRGLLRKARGRQRRRAMASAHS